MPTHSRIRLDLVGQDNGDVELLRELLQSSEVLVEFLPVSELSASAQADSPVAFQIARLDRSSPALFR